MKVRTGFVANSSSSSFVVGLPKSFLPSRTNIGELFFPEKSQIYSPRFGKSLSTEVAIEILYAQLRMQKPNRMAKILAALEGPLPGGPDLDNPKYHGPQTIDGDIDWDSYDDDVEAYRLGFYEQLIQQIRDAKQNAWVFELDNETIPEGILVDAEIFKSFIHAQVDQG
jgi:hypothetical protein